MNLNSLAGASSDPTVWQWGRALHHTGARAPRPQGQPVSVPEFVWLAACCAVPAGGWAMGFVKHTRDREVIEDVC